MPNKFNTIMVTQKEYLTLTIEKFYSCNVPDPASGPFFTSKWGLYYIDFGNTIHVLNKYKKATVAERPLSLLFLCE